MLPSCIGYSDNPEADFLKTDFHYPACLTCMPRSALTQASDASQIAVRSWPPSSAKTRRPPARDMSWRVRKLKPEVDKHTEMLTWRMNHAKANKEWSLCYELQWWWEHVSQDSKTFTIISDILQKQRYIFTLWILPQQHYQLPITIIMETSVIKPVTVEGTAPALLSTLDRSCNNLFISLNVVHSAIK